MLIGLYEVQGDLNDIGREATSKNDTLIIIDDKNFKTNYWGNRTYKLKYSINGTRIHFTYKYEHGFAGYITSVKRKYCYGNPKINLNYDSEVYFDKITSN